MFDRFPYDRVMYMFDIATYNVVFLTCTGEVRHVSSPRNVCVSPCCEPSSLYYRAIITVIYLCRLHQYHVLKFVCVKFIYRI